MFDSRKDEEPKLQLELAGGGPGSRVRTAVGAGDEDFRIDRTVLPEPPFWFRFFRNGAKLVIPHPSLCCHLSLRFLYWKELTFHLYTDLDWA